MFAIALKIQLEIALKIQLESFIHLEDIVTFISCVCTSHAKIRSHASPRLLLMEFISCYTFVHDRTV
jgi:hypothetical protein